MNIMSYFIITLLIIGGIFLALKAYTILRLGMQKTYTLTGKQMLLQYLMLIFLLLSIISRHWEKLMKP